MILGVVDWQNDCNFGIEFDAKEKLELVKKLAIDGLATWYQAAHDDKTNEYFTKDEVEAFYDSGYAEPTSELLDRYGITHKIVDLKYDENNECVTKCDEVVWY